MGKLLADIFTMNFDIVMPLTWCILAIFLAAVLFCIRYFSFMRNRRRYEKKAREQAKLTAVSEETDSSSSSLSG